MTAAYQPGGPGAAAPMDERASSPAQPAAAGVSALKVAPPLHMTHADLDEVMSLEQAAYAFPWTRGNFTDALDSGYTGLCLRAVQGPLIGYSVLMPVVDEVHLLNLCVAPTCRRQGLGAALLATSMAAARASGFGSMLLEVRLSNLPALGLYQRFDFAVIGRRKRYYPAPGGSREDALVMRREDLSAPTLETLHVLA